MISMPDKWEYPWFAAWDLAFHCGALALVDVDFAKDQIELLLKRALPAPERPDPRLRVGLRRCQSAGAGDGGAEGVPRRARAARQAATSDFLQRVTHKLLMNYTWWLNRKDADGNNVFEGGFLGPGQHLGVRPLAAAAAGLSASSRPTPPAGWRCSR